MGIGSVLLEALIGESEGSGVAITIHVERNNPALGWYERYGFRLAEDKGVYLFMRRDVAS